MDKVRDYIIKALAYFGDVLDEDYKDFIILRDDDERIIFSEVQVLKGMPEDEIEVQHSRSEFETASCEWLVDHLDQVEDARIMFGIAQLHVLTPDRGMLRHVIDWTNSDHIKCAWNIIATKGSD